MLALVSPSAGPAAPAVESDLRVVPWHSLRRAALLGGEFVAPYRPVSERELARLLERAGARARRGAIRGEWSGFELAAGGRVALWELGPGNLVAAESGLAGNGLVLVAEADLEVTNGRWWAGFVPRLGGRLARSGPTVPGALLDGNWPPPTNRPALAAARRDEAWRVTVPRAAGGVAFGSWAIAAGVFPAAVGPGLAGDGLTLTSQSASLPQVVLRRTAPFAWSGAMGPLDPDHLLLRVGLASEQTIAYEDEWGRQSRRDRPLFCQWLLTWNHTSWWRTTLTHASLAAPRAGQTLWGDLLQINAPLLSATWNEVDYGPVTDRIFTATMEARFRAAPWPLLPRGAGRLFWEYGGEDFRPYDSVPVVPEISAPASLVGCELVDERWDLGLEYLETRHPLVLWYGNSGFDRGYSHDGVVLGHPLGGAAESWTAVVRLRPRSGACEWELRGRTSAWDMAGRLPSRAEVRELSVGWRSIAAGGREWILAASWLAEDVATGRADWLQARAECRF